MGSKTAIGWCDHTFNIVWGCVKVSEECKNCYAQTWAERYGYKVFGPLAPRRVFGEKHWQEPLAWNAKAQKAQGRRRVFCSSMADVYEDHPVVNELRPRLWGLIEQTPWLDWLVLTKRPENVLRMTPSYPNNLWIGTSVGLQKRVNERLPALVEVPAAIRFLSCEPLLEAIDLSPWLDLIDWVITGAESGKGARPMQHDWVRALRNQCQYQHVPLFYKQDVVNGEKIVEPELDGKQWVEFPESPAVATLWR